MYQSTEWVMWSVSAMSPLLSRDFMIPNLSWVELGGKVIFPIFPTHDRRHQKRNTTPETKHDTRNKTQHQKQNTTPETKHDTRNEIRHQKHQKQILH